MERSSRRTYKKKRKLELGLENIKKRLYRDSRKAMKERTKRTLTEL